MPRAAETSLASIVFSERLTVPIWLRMESESRKDPPPRSVMILSASSEILIPSLSQTERKKSCMTFGSARLKR